MTAHQPLHARHEKCDVFEGFWILDPSAFLMMQTIGSQRLCALLTEAVTIIETKAFIIYES